MTDISFGNVNHTRKNSKPQTDEKIDRIVYRLTGTKQKSNKFPIIGFEQGFEALDGNRSF